MASHFPRHHRWLFSIFRKDLPVPNFIILRVYKKRVPIEPVADWLALRSSIHFGRRFYPPSIRQRMRAILHQPYQVPNIRGKKKAFLYDREVGLLDILLRININLRIFHPPSNLLHALMAGRKWRLHRLPALRKILRRGHMGDVSLLRNPVRQTFRSILPARLHPTIRQLLRVHLASRSIDVPDLLLVHDELLDDRDLHSDDT